MFTGIAGSWKGIEFLVYLQDEKIIEDTDMFKQRFSAEYPKLTLQPGNQIPQGIRLSSVFTVPCGAVYVSSS